MNDSPHISDDRLAAYFDGEAPETEALTIEQHVANCGACRQVLDDMALTRNALRAVEVPALSDNVWERVETALEPRRAAPVLFLSRISRMAIAAAIVFCMTTFAVLALVDLGGKDEPLSSLPMVSASAPFDLGWYLASLDHAGRLPALPAPFEIKRVSSGEALEAAGVSEDLDLDVLPASLALVEALVISDGAFQLAQLTYQDERGGVLLFCQPRSSPVSFANFPVETTTVGSKPCLSVYCGTYRALSVSTAQGTYTVVGRRNNPMLSQIIETLSAD
ncbi:MAG: anti-sigma factor family protein [Rhodothermales bacterium]